MRIGVDGYRVALICLPREHILIVGELVGRKEGHLNIVFLQNIQELRCVLAGTIIEGQVDDLALGRRIRPLARDILGRILADGHLPATGRRVVVGVGHRVIQGIGPLLVRIDRSLDLDLIRDVSVHIVHSGVLILVLALQSDGDLVAPDQVDHRSDPVVIIDLPGLGRRISGLIRDGIGHDSGLFLLLHLVRHIPVHGIIGGVALLLIGLARQGIGIRLGLQGDFGRRQVLDRDHPVFIQLPGAQMGLEANVVIPQLAGVDRSDHLKLGRGLHEFQNASCHIGPRILGIPLRPVVNFLSPVLRALDLHLPSIDPKQENQCKEYNPCHFPAHRNLPPLASVLLQHNHLLTSFTPASHRTWALKISSSRVCSKDPIIFQNFQEGKTFHSFS